MTPGVSHLFLSAPKQKQKLLVVELLVEYATYGMDSNLFVSKYELYLPNKEELRSMVNDIIAISPNNSNKNEFVRNLTNSQNNNIIHPSGAWALYP